MLGVAIGRYLSWGTFDAGVEVSCSGVGDCYSVQSSAYSEITGIPIALLGLVM